METKKFQENLVDDIRLVLANKEVPLARVKELANAALALDDKFPGGIPEAEAVRLLGEYDEITKGSKEKYRLEMEAAAQDKIEEVRRSLGIDDKK